jgi:hypothetical protein
MAGGGRGITDVFPKMGCLAPSAKPWLTSFTMAFLFVCSLIKASF